MDFMNLNQSAHGDREFGYMLTRLRIPRTTVVGHWQDSEVVARLGHWVRAAAGAAEARRLRVCRFGDNMRQVGVTEGDKTEVQVRLGVATDGWGVNELVAAMRAAPAADVDAIVADCLERYDMAPELARGGARHESLRESAAIEVGLRTLLERGGYRAFTDSFEDLGDLPQLPGLAVQRLMADGYGFGGEGDWKTSALVRAMKVIAADLPGGVSFMEDYTYHLEPGNHLVLGSHMLEICPSIAAGKPSLEIHPLGIGGKEDPVRLVFDSPAGEGLNASLIDLGNRFRLLVNTVKAELPPEPLPKLPVARVVWKPQPDFATACAAWILAGGAHHTGYSCVVTPEHLEDFSEMAGIELVSIDKDTKLGEFKKELRWNDLYYHIAPGLKGI
jgi:L-arabinose isomerase